MNFDETPEFKKDVKALKRRVPTIVSDIERVQPRISALYVEREDIDINLAEFREQFFSSKKATRLPGSTDDIGIIKMRLDTDSDQYRTKLRLVFTAIRQDNKILFIELYSKSDKDHADQNRIKRYA